MNLKEFITENRKEIDEFIRRQTVPKLSIDDEERRLWILNNEALYHWAKSQGVKI